VIKGFLYLCLYYSAAGILAGVFAINSSVLSQKVLDILTPASAFSAREYGAFSASVIGGLLLQLVAIGILLRAIAIRLDLPVATRTAVAD
jgi:hypothetical protein